MTAVFAVTLGLLSLGGALTLLRLARGPSTLDRILAVEVLLVLIVSGIAVGAAARDAPADIGLLLIVTLLAFVGTVTAARFTQRRMR